MLNEFLTHTLQVVIVIDVVGVIAWFVLAARRTPQKVATATAVGTLTDARATDPRATLWGKLTGSRNQLRATAAQRAGQSLDDALGQLRRVLDGYGNSLA